MGMRNQIIAGSWIRFQGFDLKAADATSSPHAFPVELNGEWAEVDILERNGLRRCFQELVIPRHVNRFELGVELLQLPIPVSLSDVVRNCLPQLITDRLQPIAQVTQATAVAVSELRGRDRPAGRACMERQISHAAQIGAVVVEYGLSGRWRYAMVRTTPCVLKPARQPPALTKRLHLALP